MEFFLNDNGYAEIGFCDGYDISSAELSNFLLVDSAYLFCALSDIFLDSAIFNSYSFLQKLSSEQKRDFNIIKVEFLQKKYGDFSKFNSPFYEFLNTTYDYLSLAFFTRESEKIIDVDKFIALWDELIATYYNNETHKEPSIEAQLANLDNLDQYSISIKEKCLQLAPGTHWLLRIHKEPPKNRREWLTQIFGSYNLGSEALLPSDRFESIYSLVQEQVITAYKLIKQA